MKIIYNAKVHTLEPRAPRASALAIDSGRILAIGDSQLILAEFGEGLPGERHTEREDAGGRTILPGLCDAHIHLEQYALSLQKIDCEVPVRAEVLRRVAEQARTTPKGQWILGHGWNQNEWEGGFGNAAELDATAPDHPVYLTAKSLHAAWANTAALRLAGIDRDTPDPKDGRIRRIATGEPDGILYETAMELVEAAIPEPSEEEVAGAIRQAQANLWQMGLTAAHDFDRRRCFSALQLLHARGQLGLRVTKSLPLEMLEHAVEVGLRTGFGDDFLRIGSVKGFADGALGPQTAAMLQPYEGSGDDRGILMLDAEELYERGSLAVRNGLSLAVHAIGDRANHEVLAAYSHLRELERSLQPADFQPLRHRIEHVQLLHPDDAQRLAQLGVIASMQPIHVSSDLHMADRYWGARARYAYAWRLQLQNGAPLAFGSDAPVENPNPFWGLFAATRRQSVDGAPGPEGWYPEERLTLFEALQAYTTGAAYAAGTEDRQGKLLPGYYADLILLDEDPLEAQPEALYEMRPAATMVNGEWVYRA